MPELLGHWVPVPILALGFWFLLKRTFTDFEKKLADLFKQMADTLSEQQEHDKRIDLLAQRVEQLERRGRRR